MEWMEVVKKSEKRKAKREKRKEKSVRRRGVLRRKRRNFSHRFTRINTDFFKDCFGYFIEILLEDIEKDHIIQVLESTNWRLSGKLGIN